MKHILFASAAASVAVRAFNNATPDAFNSTCEVVNVTGADGKPVRVNRSDYDADQAEGGAKAFTLHKDDAPQPQPGATDTSPLPEGVTIPPAPSAPPSVDPIPPQTPSPGARLVQKRGTGAKTRYYVVTKEGDTFPDVTGVTGIDESGYATDQEAWAAILAAPPVAPAA